MEPFCEFVTLFLSNMAMDWRILCTFSMQCGSRTVADLEIIAWRRVVCPLLVQAAVTAFLRGFGHHAIGSIQVEHGVALVRLPEVIHVKATSIVEEDHDCQKSGNDLDGKWQNNETDS
mmetsp:Transcript_68417/g.107536  ORF Transcript_68417/g.107536 Transcript_68417/m.107536 type:complete len:118 (-) Transcript_68417:1083-1436(-)